MLDLLPQLLSLLLFTPLAMLWGGCCCGEECVPPPYKLTLCDDPGTIIYTNDSRLDGYLGKIAQIDGDCYHIGCGTGTPAAINLEAIFENCSDCTTPGTFGGCPDCANTTSASEWTVSFVGGLTDGCSICDEVTGEFTLTSLGGSSCLFDYTGSNTCNGGCGVQRVSVALAISKNGSNCEYALFIGLTDTGLCLTRAVYQFTTDKPIPLVMVVPFVSEVITVCGGTMASVSVTLTRTA